MNFVELPHATKEKLGPIVIRSRPGTLVTSLLDVDTFGTNVNEVQRHQLLWKLLF